MVDGKTARVTIPAQLPIGETIVVPRPDIDEPGRPGIFIAGSAAGQAALQRERERLQQIQGVTERLTFRSREGFELSVIDVRRSQADLQQRIQATTDPRERQALEELRQAKSRQEAGFGVPEPTPISGAPIRGVPEPTRVEREGVVTTDPVLIAETIRQARPELSEETVQQLVEQQIRVARAQQIAGRPVGTAPITEQQIAVTRLQQDIEVFNLQFAGKAETQEGRRLLSRIQLQQQTLGLPVSTAAEAPPAPAAGIIQAVIEPQPERAPGPPQQLVLRRDPFRDFVTRVTETGISFGEVGEQLPGKRVPIPFVDIRVPTDVRTTQFLRGTGRALGVGFEATAGTLLEAGRTAVGIISPEFERAAPITQEQARTAVIFERLGLVDVREQPSGPEIVFGREQLKEVGGLVALFGTPAAAKFAQRAGRTLSADLPVLAAEEAGIFRPSRSLRKAMSRERRQAQRAARAARRPERLAQPPRPLFEPGFRPTKEVRRPTRAFQTEIERQRLRELRREPPTGVERAQFRRAVKELRKVDQETAKAARVQAVQVSPTQQAIQRIRERRVERPIRQVFQDADTIIVKREAGQRRRVQVRQEQRVKELLDIRTEQLATQQRVRRVFAPAEKVAPEVPRLELTGLVEERFRRIPIGRRATAELRFARPITFAIPEAAKTLGARAGVAEITRVRRVRALPEIQDVVPRVDIAEIARAERLPITAPQLQFREVTLQLPRIRQEIRARSLTIPRLAEQSLQEARTISAALVSPVELTLPIVAEALAFQEATLRAPITRQITLQRLQVPERQRTRIRQRFFDLFRPSREFRRPFQPRDSRFPPREPFRRRPPFLLFPLKARSRPEIERVPFRAEFQAFLRREGQFLPIGRPSPFNVATLLGREAARTTLARSFLLRPTGRVIRERDIPRPTLAQFRRPFGKTRLPRGTFVEKAKFALDVPSEVKAIQRARGQASERKQAQGLFTRLFGVRNI